MTGDESAFFSENCYSVLRTVSYYLGGGSVAERQVLQQEAWLCFPPSNLVEHVMVPSAAVGLRHTPSMGRQLTNSTDQHRTRPDVSPAAGSFCLLQSHCSGLHVPSGLDTAALFCHIKTIHSFVTATAKYAIIQQ